MTRLSTHMAALFWGGILTLHGSPAVLLFEDDFNRGIPGWTAVQPVDTYIEGPMRWQYDIVSGSFVEQSNIYTGSPEGSQTATAVMLINDAVTGTNFTYRARLTAGDDDAFGLIFGFQDANNFYRVNFTRQLRAMAIYPWNGWNVDRKVNNVATNLFGHGTPDHVDSFFNTQYQPFDVIIQVQGNNLFSLTVIDDPEGAAIEYPLVESQPLPGPADGRVGIFSWGMAGTAIRGFRIQNPTLEPGGLVGNPNALEDWAPVVTPRGDGSGLDPGSGNGGQPIWSLALGPNGAYGTLHENSDAFGGNDDLGIVDFSAPTLVTGDPAWSNYVYSVRILPADDDGHGIVLRYKDELNFYRVALRNQDSATGPRKGLSIQKVVNGVWEEIYYDDPVVFDPVPNVPYEISAVAFDNLLQVVVVADPDGAAQSYSYGPFELSGDTIPAGRVGVFSWGMSRTEFDNVRVLGVDGIPLQVVSEYGDPMPAEGLHGFPPGSSVTASVTSPFEETPGVRRVVTGWSGLGSVPASGTGSSTTFNLNEISLIRWLWTTEVRLEVTAGPGGEVQAPPGEWFPEGTNIVISAQANPGFVFVGWSGDLSPADSTVNLTLIRPLTLQARFEADTDADGLPDPWETSYFGNLDSGANDDPDSDGVSNIAEYRRGTDPTTEEMLLSDGGLSSRWENVQRDPALPGQLVVRDFGDGFRGVWENSNDYQQAVPPNRIGPDFSVPLVSFEGPRIIISTNVWNPAWTDFTASAVFSVGDNDGNCVYFRYNGENDWYRVTVCGENNNAEWRAPFGVSVQKRVDGVFTELAQDASIATDPSDTSFYKRVRVTVSADGPNFEIRVTGWNTFVTPPEWDTGAELVLQIFDEDHPSGRFGVGTWGQSGGGPATETNPVNAGVLIEDVVVTVDGNEVFSEDWTMVPLANELGDWTNAWTESTAGTWQVTAHGSLLQTSNFGPSTTSTSAFPRGDADGPIILAPVTGLTNFFLELGFHPFDDDGMGFVYDFQDTNNYSRVLFVSEPSGPGRVPQGLTVSRKSDGMWSDLIAGDTSFVYTNGSPFIVEFAKNNGEYRLTARHADSPSESASWSWTGPADTSGQVGFACWGSTDAHFTHARVYSLAARDGGPGDELAIESATVSGGNLVLEISNPGGAPYDVEVSETLAPGSWVITAAGQTGDQWTIAIDTAKAGVFYRLVRR